MKHQNNENHKCESKVLFILKKRKIYENTPVVKTIHSGLYNSANFVNKMLNEYGVDSTLVQVVDNNDIDREVNKYNPTDVIIEALWVVPEKFDVLHKLHPKVNWIIRLHSEMPFISNEGIAIEWLFEYDKMGERNNLVIAANTQKMFHDLKSVGIKNIILLPNYYPVGHNKLVPHDHTPHINIGCFGAIRPMKNQLIQAVAAIDFGNQLNKTVHFHINADRIEKGETALKNIRALFDNQKRHKLIEHPWYDHIEFVHLIRKMDVGLQVSFNETFNIVGADFAANNVPLVGSKEISWLSCFYKAYPTDSKDIVEKLKFAYKNRNLNLQWLNKIGLRATSRKARKIWLKAFKRRK